MILFFGMEGDNKGDHISLDREYAYRVYVEDSSGNYDQTKSSLLNVATFENEKQRDGLFGI